MSFKLIVQAELNSTDHNLYKSSFKLKLRYKESVLDPFFVACMTFGKFLHS